MSWVKRMSCEKNLHAVYTEARPCVKFLVANVALEVLRFLVLDQNLLIIKLPIAVPVIKTFSLTLAAEHGRLAADEQIY